MATLLDILGALLLLDTYQSAGSLPLALADWGVDAATGGSVKWLCGGPGVAYLYVRPDLVGSLEPRVTGWAAHAAPFFLLPRIGLAATVFLASSFNLAVFVVARGKAFGEAPAVSDDDDRPAEIPAGRLGLMQVPFFLTGFVALAAETVWNRVFSFFFTSSVRRFQHIHELGKVFMVRVLSSLQLFL